MPKILIVEDEMVLREAYTILLQAQGLEVHAASNGLEALGLWKENSYDLVLLDLMMPVLDGIGFLEGARPQETAPATRIVILSNLSSGDMPERALALGAHRHEVKANLAPRDVVAIVNDEASSSAGSHS